MEIDAGVDGLADIITAKLDIIGLKWKRTGEEYITSECLNPSHNDKNPSFAINTTTGGGKCFSCKFPVNVEFWLGGILDEEQFEEFTRMAKYSKLRTIQEDAKELAPPLQVPRDSGQSIPTNWRGLSEEWIIEFRLYHCDLGKYSNRYIFPMLDGNEHMIAYNSRDLDPENKTNKYMYSKGLNTKTTLYPEWLLKVHRPSTLLIVEGFMDCISAWQLGLPAIANFGAAVSFKMDKIALLMSYGIETIVLVMDEDEAGKAVQTAYEESIMPEYFDVIIGKKYKPLKDFYVSGKKDLSEYLEFKNSGEER